MRRLASITLITTISALLALISFGTIALADSPDPNGQAKFTMSALDSDRGYVEFDAEPGDRLVINLVIKNTGEAAGVADLYATDAYTLRNGGFGARGIDDERGGETEWVNYTAEAFDLEPETEQIETVTIDVPDDVAPGEYLTAMVIQNQEPTPLTEEGAGIQLDQVSRHAIAILINIEGEREYGLEIGQAEHRQTGHSSSVYVEVSNTGNAMLRPDSGEFLLEDADGFEMLRQDASMNVVYAGHETHFALNLGERLEPGDYLVSLTLVDEARGVSTSVERIGMNVEEPPEPEITDEDGGITGLIQPPRLPGDGGSGSWWTLLGIVALVSMLATIVGVLIGRRRRQAGPAMAATMIDPEPHSEPTEATVNAAAQAYIERTRQATPERPNRSSGGIKPLIPKQEMDR